MIEVCQRMISCVILRCLVIVIGGSCLKRDTTSSFLHLLDQIYIPFTAGSRRNVDGRVYCFMESFSLEYK